MNRRRWIYSAGLLAATLGLGAAPAGADVSSANIGPVTLIDNGNETVTVIVTGTQPFGPVSLTAGTGNCLNDLAGQTAYTNDGNGNPTMLLAGIALKAAPRAGGTDFYNVTDGRNGIVASGNITCAAVLGAIVENPSTEVLDTNTAPGTNLPRTGGDIKAPVGLALVLVASGGALVIGTRKARKAAVRVED